MILVYWSKVLTDQQGLCIFFRKHKIVKNLKTAKIKQVIVHLSNLLKCVFREKVIMLFFFCVCVCVCVCVCLGGGGGQKMKSALPNYSFCAAIYQR